ncbi:MAG: hypothetical protein BYD32DRAFT_404594 [Podila humilis]|nr:MAG: hypothetical protein BYD32DRAFT_404594 [Podila humilis]
MCIEHKGNWQEEGRRWARRTKFHYALKEATEDVGIRYCTLPERIELLDSNLATEVMTHTSQSTGSPDRRRSSSASTKAVATTSESHQESNEDTLTPQSPSRQHMQEQVGRLYHRNVNRRPLDDVEGRE